MRLKVCLKSALCEVHPRFKAPLRQHDLDLEEPHIRLVPVGKCTVGARHSFFLPAAAAPPPKIAANTIPMRLSHLTNSNHFNDLELLESSSWCLPFAMASSTKRVADSTGFGKSFSRHFKAQNSIASPRADEDPAIAAFSQSTHQKLAISSRSVIRRCVRRPPSPHGDTSDRPLPGRAARRSPLPTRYDYGADEITTN